MEGLIPLVYKAIVQYKNGAVGHGQMGSPSSSYMRLPGDSGRFQSSAIQLFQSEYGFTTTTSSPSSKTNSSASTTQITISTGVQSPVCRITSRRHIK